MDKIDTLLVEVNDKMRAMFLKLDELDREKTTLMDRYSNATAEEKNLLEQAMKQSEEKYKQLSNQMTQLLNYVKKFSGER